MGEGERRIHVEPADHLSLRVEIDFPGLGPQLYETDDPLSCLDARTFGFLREAEALREAGLALGAGLHNTLVFDDEGQPAGTDGLRHPDEPARHKCLDLLGDLALLGAPLCGRITAVRAGHALHHQLVACLTRTADLDITISSSRMDEAL